MIWKIRDRTLNLSEKTWIMGIVNVTPDSFSDGGSFFGVEEAVTHAKQLVADGADLLDIGGESSRPGAQLVPAEEEWRRVQPVLERLVKEVDVPLSIDTNKAEVAEKALGLGAHIVNDITGLTGDPLMAEVVKRFGAGAIIMHMQGKPQSMQEYPTYAHVVEEVKKWLAARLLELEGIGVAKEALVVDPGIGFGKTAEHNMELLANGVQFNSLGRPLLVGPSRKAFIGKILNLPVTDRVEGTVAASVLAVWNGANIVRVHDVKAVKRAVQVVDACKVFKKEKSEDRIQKSE